LGGLCAFAAGLALQKLCCFDDWLHLRTGQLIWETGAVPRVDLYSYTLPGEPWVDVYWLFQLGLHGLYALGGHAVASDLFPVRRGAGEYAELMSLVGQARFYDAVGHPLRAQDALEETRRRYPRWFSAAD
jgi:hypothetical protein